MTEVSAPSGGIHRNVYSGESHEPQYLIYFMFILSPIDGSLSSASSHSSETGAQTAISFAVTPTATITAPSGTTPTNTGKDFGGLDFKIIVDAKLGPPITIHLVAPTLQEKTAWISDISQVSGTPSIHWPFCNWTWHETCDQTKCD